MHRSFSEGLRSVLGERSKLFTLLWILTFSPIFLISLVNPAIPYLVKVFVTEEAAAVTLIGFLNASFNLSKTLANVPGGILADKLGRKILITFSLLILPFSFLLYYLSDNCYYLIAGELVGGIAIGLLVPAVSALVADITSAAALSTAYGIFNLSWILSQIPSPILGGFLSNVVGLKFPFLVALIASIPCIIASLKLDGRAEAVKHAEDSEKPSWEGGGSPGGSYGRTLALFCGVEVLNGLGNGILATLLIVYPLYALRVSVLEMGIIFSVSWGIATAVSQIPGGRLADKFGEKPLIIASIMGFTPILILLPTAQTLTQYLFLLGLSCVIGNLSIPAYSSWLATSIPPTKRGAGFGATSAAFGSGSIIGPLIGSILWNILKPNAMIAFASAAIIFALTIPLIYMIKS
ncbi:MAG TPA: MFS transporter [Nitrososphaeria archaeon]|nr:MFS transporter [Nitrososphaeria archaeon]